MKTAPQPVVAFNSSELRKWLVAACALTMLVPLSAQADPSANPASLDTVRGQACYTYGDNETPVQAKKAALALAQEQAVKSYRVYVQSSSTVKNFQLEDDLIQSASAGMLQDVQIEKQEKKEQEFCTAITAKISPVKMEDLIQQRTKAKDVAQTAATPILTSSSGFGLKVWTNKEPGTSFVEGESVIISVQSDQDAYLKLDYFQADGTVVHLVPNMFGGQTFIRAGQTYMFGGSDSPEAFEVSEPFGAETIKVLASTQPFERSFSSSNNVEESRGYLSNLQLTTRGVIINPGTAKAGAAHWAEASTRLTTTSKATSAHSATLASVRGAKKRQ